MLIAAMAGSVCALMEATEPLLFAGRGYDAWRIFKILIWAMIAIMNISMIKKHRKRNQQLQRVCLSSFFAPKAREEGSQMFHIWLPSRCHASGIEKFQTQSEAYRIPAFSETHPSPILLPPSIFSVRAAH